MTRMMTFAERAGAMSMILAALAACGGGGGGGNGNNDPPPPPALTISVSTLASGTVGVPYNQTVSASGGTGSRTFSVTAGALPDGLALTTSTGVIAGTPLGPAGQSDFTITVEDSGSPQQSDVQALSITINATALGRNDTIATATPIGNVSFAASISPSGNPNTVLAADQDYYVVTTTAASTVTVDINAQVNGSPLDSVIEIVNASGTPLTTCRDPDTDLFNATCISDDEVLGVDLDSFLELQVAGATTFYIHVVDWGSNARPDKTYDLLVSGVN